MAIDDNKFKQLSTYFYVGHACLSVLVYLCWLLFERHVFTTIGAFGLIIFIPVSLFQAIILFYKIYKHTLERYLKVFVLLILNYALLMAYVYGINHHMHLSKVVFVNEHSDTNMSRIRYRQGHEGEWKELGPLPGNESKTVKLLVKKEQWFYWGVHWENNPTTEKAFKLEPGKPKVFQVIYTEQEKFKRVLRNRFR